MKLWYSPASPFVRKVLILAYETGLADQLELHDASTTAINPNHDLARDNPLGKIPTLVLEDGTSLFDSRVICEYLDGLHEGERMIPLEGTDRYNALVTQSIGDGLMDAAVSTRYEQFLRPQGKQWDKWIEGQMQKVEQALDVLENWRGARLQDVHIGSISVVAGLDYLDFRKFDIDWRKGRPVLTQMFETFSKRTSMIETEPKG